MKINGHLYQLSNKNILRVDSSCNNPDYEYSYDYFDGRTKKLIDGGVFNLEEDENNSTKYIVDVAMRWCELDPDKVSRSLIGEDVEYSDLEEDGYTGF